MVNILPGRLDTFTTKVVIHSLRNNLLYDIFEVFGKCTLDAKIHNYQANR